MVTWVIQIIMEVYTVQPEVRGENDAFWRGRDTTIMATYKWEHARKLRVWRAGEMHWKVIPQEGSRQ